MRPLFRCYILVALLFPATQISAQIIVINGSIAYDLTANYSRIGGTVLVIANGDLEWTDVPEVTNPSALEKKLKRVWFLGFAVSSGTIYHTKSSANLAGSP